MVKTLEEALSLIAELEAENKALREDLSITSPENLPDARSMMRHGWLLIMILL